MSESLQEGFSYCEIFVYMHGLLDDDRLDHQPMMSIVQKCDFVSSCDKSAIDHLSDIAY